MALVNLRGAEYDNQMIRNFPQADFWPGTGKLTSG
jgi:hypothetical protein